MRKTKPAKKPYGVPNIPGSLPLVTIRPSTNVSKKASFKLTVAQRDVVLEYLSRGWPMGTVCEKLRLEQEIVLDRTTLRSYLQSNRDELEQRRQRWLASLEDEPLAKPRTRLREYLKQYAACIVHMFKEPCPTCLGTGMVMVLPPTKDDPEPQFQSFNPGDKPRRKITLKEESPPQKKKKSQDTPGEPGNGAEPGPIQFCPVCKGRKWALPPKAKEMLKSLDGDIRLDTLPDLPPSLHGEWMDRAQELLQRIREEVGDAWSPREKGQGADEQHLHLHGDDAKATADALRQLLAAPPEKIVEVYQKRKALPQKGGA